MYVLNLKIFLLDLEYSFSRKRDTMTKINHVRSTSTEFLFCFVSRTHTYTHTQAATLKIVKEISNFRMAVWIVHADGLWIYNEGNK